MQPHKKQALTEDESTVSGTTDHLKGDQGPQSITEHESEDHDESLHIDEKWLVSYADLMTLLFGLFVLLYSLSIQKGGNMKEQLEAMSASFAKNDTTQTNPEWTEEKVQKIIVERDQLQAKVQENSVEVEKLKRSVASLEEEKQKLNEKIIEKEKLTEKKDQPVLDTEALLEKIKKLEKQIEEDKERIAKLEEQALKDKERIVKLEAQALKDKERITKLEEQALKDKERIAKLEDQALKDKALIVKLEEEIKKLKEQLKQALERSEINGGTHNFMMLASKWNTEKHDIDMTVKDPSGRIYSYKKRRHSEGNGEFVLDSRFGPGVEMWQAKRYTVGRYEVRIQLYSTNGNEQDAKIELLAVTNAGNFDFPTLVLNKSQKEIVKFVNINDKGLVEFSDPVAAPVDIRNPAGANEKDK